MSHYRGHQGIVNVLHVTPNSTHIPPSPCHLAAIIFNAKGFEVSVNNAIQGHQNKVPSTLPLKKNPPGFLTWNLLNYQWSCYRTFSHSSRLLFLSKHHSYTLPIHNERQRVHSGSSVVVMVTDKAVRYHSLQLWKAHDHELQRNWFMCVFAHVFLIIGARPCAYVNMH